MLFVYVGNVPLTVTIKTRRDAFLITPADLTIWSIKLKTKTKPKGGGGGRRSGGGGEKADGGEDCGRRRRSPQHAPFPPPSCASTYEHPLPPSYARSDGADNAA
ncbi:MAG: hypothetical protein ACKESB_03550 [Candidatus Hodgkinia cicadicola]